MGEAPAEWQIETAYVVAGKFVRYAKKHKAEYDSLFANLEKIMQLLKTSRLHAFRVGFFRSESDGVYRIGQTGVRSAKESRMYVYPDEAKRTMYILTVGDKDSQSGDIRDAKRIVQEIRARQEQYKSGNANENEERNDNA